MGKHCLPLEACVTPVQMPSCPFKARSRTTDECSPARTATAVAPGDAAAVAGSPQSQRRFCHGVWHKETLPLGEQAEAPGSNAGRAQESHTHTHTCAHRHTERLRLLGVRLFSPQQLARLLVQSAPFGTADKVHFCSSTLCPCTRLHAARGFYGRTAGLLAREGGDGAELAV